MKDKEYKSFKEFLVRTPEKLVFTLAWILFAIIMVCLGLINKDVVHITIFWIWISFFSGLPFGTVLRVYLIYIKTNKKI